MAEETRCDSEAMRRFAGIEPGDDRSPDETTILNFRHLPERHGLTEAIFAEVNAHLADKGITLRSGTLVDMRGRTPCVRVSPRNIIDAPSSTRNTARARDPEMSSTKKGNDRYFGREEDQQTVRGTACPTNAQIGADADSGVTHSRETSTARRHDSRVRDELPHGEETSDRADKGHVGAEREAAFTEEGRVWGVMRKAAKGGKLHPIDARINRIIAMVKAKVEHPFPMIKRQFGYVTTRCRGPARNRARLFTLFALGTPFPFRRSLPA